MLRYKLTSTRNLPIHKDLFIGYPDITYLVKLTKLNRPCIQVTKDDELIGLMVLTRYNRYLKISLLLVHPSYKSKNIGNELISMAISTLNDDFSPVDFLYTVCPHQFNTDNYQSLLLKNNFQVSTIKPNGDVVYTYAQPV